MIEFLTYNPFIFPYLSLNNFIISNTVGLAGVLVILRYRQMKRRSRK